MFVCLVVIGGTVGYLMLGLSFIDALYQTVITLTTVGFREVGDFDTRLKIFTIALIVVGVGTVLYTFTLGVQMVVEGQLREILGRRRMDKKIAGLSGHVVICGWGRVGRSVALDLEREGHHVVIIDSDPDRVAGVTLPTIVGDATQDTTLRAAGIERAHSLVAALAADADNLFVTLSGRSINPALFIVARARQDESIAKLTRAGADRVVNPQELGAGRIASYIVRPHVAEFVDVVMHERSLEFRLQEVPIAASSPLLGRTLGQADLSAVGGALVLALRTADGSFVTNPSAATELQTGQVLIAVGTAHDLHRLIRAVSGE